MQKQEFIDKNISQYFADADAKTKTEIRNAVDVGVAFMESKMANFIKWYDKLSPASKCTVWPPAGSGMSTGIYNKTGVDLLNDFLKYEEKNEQNNKS